jgi:hypothetical protein
VARPDSFKDYFLTGYCIAFVRLILRIAITEIIKTKISQQEISYRGLARAITAAFLIRRLLIFEKSDHRQAKDLQEWISAAISDEPLAND